MTDFENFKEQLRSKEKFYSLLTVKKINEEEYDHVLKVWNKFEMKTTKGYLKCDILLLADVFEKFRNNSLQNYGLCPSHCLSAPGLSSDPMLNMTKLELELIPDPAYSLKKIREVECLIFLIDIVKPAIII